MVDVVNLDQRRVAAANDSRDIDIPTLLRDTLRRYEEGGMNATSAMVIFHCEIDGDAWVESFHAGKASTTERLGMLCRTRASLLPGGGSE